MSNDVIPSR